MSDSIKFAICMATYKRSDGSTPKFLTQALDSVFSQEYQNFKLFLIGDKYEDDTEINSIVGKYDSSKIFFKNLDYAAERDIYRGRNLWLYGGVNAMNIGVEEALSQGYEYICHLDHDDWWYSNHLQLFSECIQDTGSDWMCTKSTYMSSSQHLPRIQATERYTKFIPQPEKLIHSSVCMNFKKIPVRYRDIIKLTGKPGMPADADLWARTGEFIRANNLVSTFISVESCRHDEEGFESKKV